MTPTATARPSRWQVWRQLHRDDRVALQQAVLLIPAMHIIVRIVGFNRLHAWIERSPAGAPATGAAAESVTCCTLAVNRARRYAPYRGNCLSQSLTLLYMLRRRGVAPTLRLGVRLSAARLDAHAWVEFDGRVLNDTQDVHTRFAPFSTSNPPGR